MRRSGCRRPPLVQTPSHTSSHTGRCLRRCRNSDPGARSRAGAGCPAATPPDNTGIPTCPHGFPQRCQRLRPQLISMLQCILLARGGPICDGLITGLARKRQTGARGPRSRSGTGRVFGSGLFCKGFVEVGGSGMGLRIRTGEVGGTRSASVRTGRKALKGQQRFFGTRAN